MGSHRANRATTRAIAAAPSAAGGRRRAVKATRVDRHPLTGLPMIPTLVGAVAVTAAAGGAVSAGASGAAAAEATPTGAQVQAPRFVQFDTMGLDADLGDRQRAISRDSARDAEQDAADTRLQNTVETQATQRNAALSNLARSAEKQASKIKLNQWFLPTSGYHLTARFGSAGGLWANNHTGLDFAAPTGTPIVAVANGTITSTGYDGSYGNKTVETLYDGTELWYAHQSAIDVHVGDAVRGGQTIGNIGSTGNTTGPHVHLEVRPGGGDPVDPYTALVYHGLHP